MAKVVFFTCVLKISNHFIHFSPRNGELDVKKLRVLRQRDMACCLEILRPVLEKHGSPRYKIIGMFQISKPENSKF